MGPYPWRVRGLVQAQLQAMWGWNPGWVLYCFSWSLPGTQTHMWGHTHTHRQVPCAVLDAPLSQAQTGTEAQSGDQAPCATSSQPMDPCCPSEETSAPTPNPGNQFNRKQTSTTQLRSRAVPGPIWAAGGRVVLTHDHSMAELFPSKAWIWVGLILSLRSSSSH